MPLREDFVRSGTWLFRWRSYLPLIVLALVLAWVPQFKYISGRHNADLIWEGFCAGVSLVGFIVRIVTIGHAARGTSGGNTCTQVAECLNTTGMYSLVRHPLYVGNFLMWLGVVMLLHSGWPVLLVSLCFALYYERIMFAEEEFLRDKFGADYLRWAQRTPAFVPTFRRWQTPSQPFSARKVLRREYSSLLAVVAAFALLKAACDFVVHGRLIVDPVWTPLVCTTVILAGVLRFLKRHTRVLALPGH